MPRLTSKLPAMGYPCNFLVRPASAAKPPEKIAGTTTPVVASMTHKRLWNGIENLEPGDAILLRSAGTLMGRGDASEG